VVSPGLAETNVGQADGAPGEEGSETGKGNEPVKDGRTSGSQVHVGKRTPHEDEENGPERTTGTVDVGEHLGGITLLRQGGKGTRSTVHTRDTNGNDGDENDNVHEVVESLETSVLASNDKGRGVGIAGRAEQTRVGVLDKKANEEETEDVEQGDSPEDLSDGTGEGVEGILGLGSSQTDQLCS